tara:strand:- start:899 stop:1198 length:300 start_codon:yes stop_codon:yes gene_type:complete
MAEIAIEISDGVISYQLEQIGNGADCFTSQRNGLDGQTLFTVIMTLSPLVIGGIVKVVQAQIESKKYVRVLVDGVEVRGVSESTLLKIIESKKSGQAVE